MPYLKKETVVIEEVYQCDFCKSEHRDRAFISSAYFRFKFGAVHPLNLVQANNYTPIKDLPPDALLLCRWCDDMIRHSDKL